MKEGLIQLSQKAIDICDATRGKNYEGCRRCQIVSECHSGTAGGFDSLVAWRNRINDAAERVNP